MILYNVNNELKALCKLNLTRPIETANNIYIDGEEYITPEDIIEILTRNGNIRIFNGEKFKKYKLGEFGDIILNKEYVVKELEQPKKPEPKKVEVKKVEEVKKEVEKPQPKVEEVLAEPEVKEEIIEEKEEVVDNKKKRHKNNNPQQEGDK